jgi:hypothetical protein
MHFSINPKVELTAFCPLPPDIDSGFHLYELLGEWTGPSMWFDNYVCQFSSRAIQYIGKINPKRGAVTSHKSQVYYPCQMKFNTYGKDITESEKKERMEKELERLAKDGNVERYVYMVNLWEVEKEGEEYFWFRFKLSFKDTTEMAKEQGRKECGGYWALGGWVRC